MLNEAQKLAIANIEIALARVKNPQSITDLQSARWYLDQAWNKVTNFIETFVAPQTQQTDGDAVHHQQEPRSPDLKLDLE